MLSRYRNENKILNVKHSDSEAVVYQTDNATREQEHRIDKKLGSNWEKLEKHW